MASSWWDPNGDCCLLHRLIPTRLSFIRQHVLSHLTFSSSTTLSPDQPFTSLRFLDVGCGGASSPSPWHATARRCLVSTLAFPMSKSPHPTPLSTLPSLISPINTSLPNNSSAHPPLLYSTSCAHSSQHSPEPLRANDASHDLVSLRARGIDSSNSVSVQHPINE
jgi:hypothetical protein